MERKPSGFIANQNKKGCVSTKLVGAIKEFEEQNRVRAEWGLQPVVSKERKCLNCSVVFASRNENRTCNNCRSLARWKAGVGE